MRASPQDRAGAATRQPLAQSVSTDLHVLRRGFQSPSFPGLARHYALYGLTADEIAVIEGGQLIALQPPHLLLPPSLVQLFARDAVPVAADYGKMGQTALQVGNS